MQRIISGSISYCLALTVFVLLVSSPLSWAIELPATSGAVKKLPYGLRMVSGQNLDSVTLNLGKPGTASQKKPSLLSKQFAQAELFLKQKKIKQAVSGYANIVLQHRNSVEDAKIQFAAATALAQLQRKGSRRKIKKYMLQVTSTAYSSHVNQTDDTPWIAAWGDRLKDGMKIIAVSRDLLKMGMGRGSLVKVHGISGHFVVLDKMNRRWRKRIDIYMGGNLKAARQWGMQTHQISFLTGLDTRLTPSISREHYDHKNARAFPLSPLQKALSSLKVRCNRQRPSCKKWIFLKRKKILAKFSRK